jgi:hypothetical protein
MTIRRRDGKRSFSDKLFKCATTQGYPDQKYGLKIFYEPANAVLE